MDKFQKIAAIDILNITDEGKQELQKFSQTPIVYPDTHPVDLAQTEERIGDADAILISYETELSSQIIAAAPNLKYIGICASSLAYIPQQIVEQRSITVTNVTDYSEEGTAEYIFLQLLKLVRGDGLYQWRENQAELNGKIIGIIGMGPVGKQVAKLALGLEMIVLYNCLKPKAELRNKNMQFVDLDTLLRSSEIISVHVPKDTIVLGSEQFNCIKPGAILVDASLGKVFEEKYFLDWIGKEENYAIFDRSVSEDYYKTFAGLPNVTLCPDVAGITQEAKERLTTKAIYNIATYLSQK